MSSHDATGVEWLRSQDFYELCQRYRHAQDIIAAGPGLPTASEAFEELQREIEARFATSETAAIVQVLPLAPQPETITTCTGSDPHVAPLLTPSARVPQGCWMFSGRAEDLPDGPPVEPGTKLYAFDDRGTWTYNIPPLPEAPHA